MSSSLRVLLVEDNPDDRALLLLTLRKDYDEIEADEILDARALHEALACRRFDVVITDFQLRWSDGIRVLKLVKSRFPDCPVIMFTGTGNEEVAVEAMKNGLDDYVVKKPSHIIRLQAAVRAALEHSHAARSMVALENRLQTLLERINVGVFRCSPERKLLEWNAAFARLLGRPQSHGGEVVEIFQEFLNTTPYSRLLDRMQKFDEPASFQVKWKNPNQSPIWLAVNVAVANTANGETLFDGLIEDITTQKRAERSAERRARAGSRLSLLSPRERDVMKLVVVGKINKVISMELGISPKTVEMHRSKMMKKLRVTSVAELVHLSLSAAPLDELSPSTMSG